MRTKILISGCTHGDKPLSKYIFDRYPVGQNESFSWRTLIANSEAMVSNQRFIDTDINRAFPGKVDGNDEERRAHEIRQISAEYDLVIDIHQSVSEMDDIVVVPALTPYLKEICQYLSIRQIIDLSNSHGGYNGLSFCQVENGIRLEYGRLHDFENTCHRVGRDIHNLLHKQVVTTHPNYYRVFGSLESSAQKKVQLQNFQNLTDQELAILEISEKAIYPCFIGQYPDKYCILLQKLSWEGNHQQHQTTFTVTTPLYYTNDKPHIGSAYTTIAGDAIARHQRQRGKTVRMITGTDEHGQKIEQTARYRGMSPQAHCDEISQDFKRLWQQIQIVCDSFIRTTDPRHERVVKEFFLRVWNAGDIYLGVQQGWYCVACEEYKDEKELLPHQKCPIHSNRNCEWRDESNYFFRLSAYQERLLTWYAEHPDFIRPESRRNEVLSFVNQGLRDFSISRIDLDWGFPLPTNPHHTLYVWFDALLGYITALLEQEDKPGLEQAIARFWPINLHIVGKDILRFHAVYWPAMLMSAGLSLPERIFAHGFLTKDGQKMGKSMGNIIDPYALVEQYGADAVRYYFLKEIEFGRDGDFSEKRFVDVINADLANNLGNLLNRTLTMTRKYCEGKVPFIEPGRISSEHALKKASMDLGKKVSELYDQLAFSKVCKACFTLVELGNQLIDSQAPWERFKAGEVQQVNEVLYVVLESVRLVAYLMYPITPTLTAKIYQQLGYSTEYINSSDFLLWNNASWGALSAGQSLPQPEPIFQRVLEG